MKTDVELIWMLQEQNERYKLVLEQIAKSANEALASELLINSKEPCPHCLGTVSHHADDCVIN